MELNRAPKTNPAQWAVLLDFLMEHPMMVTKTFVGLDARKKYLNLWEEVATQVNSMGYGQKNVEKWIDVSSYFSLLLIVINSMK